MTLEASHLHCKGLQQAAALRCLLNHLDPHVNEAPDKLVVYGGIGRAARNRESPSVIVCELESPQNDQTLLIQSGKPVAVFSAHKDALRVLHNDLGLGMVRHTDTGYELAVKTACEQGIRIPISREQDQLSTSRASPCRKRTIALPRYR